MDIGTQRKRERKNAIWLTLHMTQNWTARSQKKDHHDAKKGPIFHTRGPVLSREGWRFSDERFSRQKILPDLDNVDGYEHNRE